MLSIIIPTYFSGKKLKLLLPLLSNLNILNEIIIVDTDSKDDTIKVASNYTDKIIRLKKSEFTHGKARLKGALISKYNYLIYLTDDALPVNYNGSNSLEVLLRSFNNDNVAAVCGRQIPFAETNPFGKHLRYFNYPEHSFERTYEDKEKYGFKTVFMSNSFAAYRRDYLEEIGWFPEDLMFGEDSHACAKLLMKGYKIMYNSDAVVYHSHSYSIKEEFKRYIEVGKFHSHQKWLLDEFGKPESEGIKFLKSEFRYLIKNGHYLSLLQQPFRAVAKYLGYKIGYTYG